MVSANTVALLAVFAELERSGQPGYVLWPAEQLARASVISRQRNNIDTGSQAYMLGMADSLLEVRERSIVATLLSEDRS